MASRSLGALTLDLVANIGGFTGPLDKAQREADKRAKQFEKTQRGNERAINSTLAAMDKEVAMLGKTSKEQRLFELATKGATQAQLKQAAASIDSVDKFTRQQEAMRRNINQAKKLGAALGAAFAAGTAAMMVNTAAQESAMAQLRQTLESTNGAIGISFDELTKKAAEFQAVTTFGDEKIIEAQSVLATFTRITGEEFNKATELALDMSVKLKKDLLSSIQQVGKALNDPIKGMSALAESGIQFTDQQKDLVQSLVDTGKEAEAQAVILKELETQFGGSARAARDTLGGAFTALGNAAGDLLEADSLGGVKSSVEDVTALLSDPETVAAAKTLANALIESFGAAVSAIKETVKFAQFAGEELARIRVGINADDIAGIEQEIDKIETLLNGSLIDKTNRLRFFGPGGMVEYYDKGELKSELDKLKAARDEFMESFNRDQPVIEPKVNIAPESGGSISPPKEVMSEWIAQLEEEDKLLEKRQNSMQKMADDLNKSSQQYQDDLSKQLALLGAQTEYERALYEVQNGRYAALDESQKQAILNSAKELDAARARIAQEEKAAELKAKSAKDFEAIRQSMLTEEQIIQQSYDRRRDIVLQNTQANSEAQKELLVRLEQEKNEELLEINGGYWEKFLSAAEDNLTSFDELSGNVIENLGKGMGSAFESMVFEAESAEDALKSLAEGMGRSVVNALGEMAGQWLAYQAVQMMVGKSTQAAAASTMTANALAGQQLAAINAFSSTAAIPIVGPPAAPAAAAAAIAATSPMVAAVTAASVSGIAHGGLENVPKESTYLLDQGERVLSPNQNRDLTQFLRNNTADGGSGAKFDIQTNVQVIGGDPNAKATTTARQVGDRQIIIDVMVDQLGNASSKPRQALQGSSNVMAKGRY